MQIFDYSNGVIGDKLDDVALMTYSGGYPTATDFATNKKVFLRLKNSKLKNGSITLAKSAGTNKKDYTPEDYGVGAIAFCMGEVFHGTGMYRESEGFAWYVVATEEWMALRLLDGFIVTV